MRILAILHVSHIKESIWSNAVNRFYTRSHISCDEKDFHLVFGVHALTQHKLGCRFDLSWIKIKSLPFGNSNLFLIFDWSNAVSIFIFERNLFFFPIWNIEQCMYLLYIFVITIREWPCFSQFPFRYLKFLSLCHSFCTSYTSLKWKFNKIETHKKHNTHRKNQPCPCLFLF